MLYLGHLRQRAELLEQEVVASPEALNSNSGKAGL